MTQRRLHRKVRQSTCFYSCNCLTSARYNCLNQSRRGRRFSLILRQRRFRQTLLAYLVLSCPAQKIRYTNYILITSQYIHETFITSPFATFQVGPVENFIARAKKGSNEKRLQQGDTLKFDFSKLGKGFLSHILWIYFPVYTFTDIKW